MSMSTSLCVQWMFSVVSPGNYALRLLIPYVHSSKP